MLHAIGNVHHGGHRGSPRIEIGKRLGVLEGFSAGAAKCHVLAMLIDTFCSTPLDASQIDVTPELPSLTR